MKRKNQPHTAPLGCDAGLSPRDRDALAGHACDLCGALLLLMEVGPHFRLAHVDDAPRVTARGDFMRSRADAAKGGAA